MGADLVAGAVPIVVFGVIGAALCWLGWRFVRGLKTTGRYASLMAPAAESVVEAEFMRRELARLQALDAGRAALVSARDQALARAAALEARLAELDGIMVETERWERSLNAERAQRSVLHAKMVEAVEARDKAVVERDQRAEESRRATERTTAVESELRALRDRSQQYTTETEISRALVTTEVLDLKKRLVSKDAAEAQLAARVAALESDRAKLLQLVGGHEAEARARLIRFQTDLAERDTRIGALEAQASRVDPLRAQVDDREVLLRSLAEERDHAMAAIRERDHDLAAVSEQGDRIAQANRRAKESLTARDHQIFALEAEITRLKKEREDLSADRTRGAHELDTMKGEIRDRDLRFQTLLNDRRRVVEAAMAEIARLKDDSRSPSTSGGSNGSNGAPRDDLKLISGIGPALESLLHSKGITTFREIAQWTDADISRVESQLGSFRNRVRRDGWVTQARQQHQDFHGELLA